MYKRLQDYITSLQQYNGKLHTELSTVEDELKRVEKERASAAENLTMLRGQLTLSQVIFFSISPFFFGKLFHFSTGNQQNLQRHEILILSSNGCNDFLKFLMLGRILLCDILSCWSSAIFSTEKICSCFQISTVSPTLPQYHLMWMKLTMYSITLLMVYLTRGTDRSILLHFISSF